MKEEVLCAADDAARKFIFYDRKNDEDLAVGDIQKAVKNGEVTIDEIVEKFKERLIDWW